VGKNVSWNCDTICQLSKEHSMIGFRSHEQKVNPATDYFCARLFPLSFFWLKAFWYSFCCICEKCLFSYEVSYPWTTSWMMFFFAQETWFQWFCKADCLCREKVIGLFAVFAQILDHSAEFFCLWCSQMLDCEWVLQSKRSCDFLWKLFISSVSDEYRNFYKRSGFLFSVIVTF